MPCFLASPSPRTRAYPEKHTSFMEQHAADSEAAGRIRRILSLEMQKARRAGHWYRLSRQDRAFFGLALRLRVKFEGPMLLRTLVGVLKRLKELGDRTYLAMQHGYRLAWVFSEAAVAWGNPHAREWRNDRTYILFLGRVLTRGTWGRSP